MPETLVIRLPDSPAAAADWVVVDADGTLRVAAAEGPLQTAAELAEGRRVIALAPAQSVLRTAAVIPLKNPAKIRQALPFALEEQLAGDVDDQHFACGKRDATGKVEVAVVTHAILQGWQEQCAAAGLRLDGLYAESDALGALPNTLTVLVGVDRSIIRDGGGLITVADHDSLHATLELLMSQENAPVTAPAALPSEATAGPDAEADAAAAEGEAAATAEALGAGPVNLLVYEHPAVQERHAMLWELLRLRVASLDIRLVDDGGPGAYGQRNPE